MTTSVMEKSAVYLPVEIAPARECRVPPETGPSEVAAIQEMLQRRIGEERFDLWFDRKTRFVLAGNTLIVEAGNAFSAKWILGKFREDLQAASGQVLARPVDIRVCVGEQVQSPAPESAPPADERPRAVSARVSPAVVPPAAWPPNAAINGRYLLEEFVVGPSNQMAYHAACRVAEFPGKQFNPLFIHGHCGLGKTHLLQGICQRHAKLHPGKKWLYVTGEQFTNEYLEAIKQHKTDAFRRRIRQADLLVIDDVHFLANKKATQEEFLHTFNQVDACGKQIILASDCAPKQIHNLSEQLSSRFVSGMVLRVDSPDLPTRLEILRRRVAKNGWNLSDTVLMHIARSSTSSVRELEGLLLQAMAGIDLINRNGAAVLGAAGEAGSVLAGIRERTAMRGPVPVERIVAAVAAHFGVNESAILGAGREKIVSLARAVAMYLARQHTGMSFPEIGRALGGKNHSTVIAACQRVEGMLSGGQLVCWISPAGPQNQAIADALHDLEGVVRRAK